MSAWKPPSGEMLGDALAADRGHLSTAARRTAMWRHRGPAHCGHGWYCRILQVAAPARAKEMASRMPVSSAWSCQNRLAGW
jgi:hypothetical protein